MQPGALSPPNNNYTVGKASKADFSQRLLIKAGLATSSARSSAAWLQSCQRNGFGGGNDHF